MPADPWIGAVFAIIGRNILIFRINDIILAKGMGGVGLSAHVKTLHFDPRAGPMKDCQSNGRRQEGKSNGIREKSRGEQKRPCKEDHCAMGKCLGRIIKR